MARNVQNVHITPIFTDYSKLPKIIQYKKLMNKREENKDKYKIFNWKQKRLTRNQNYKGVDK
jgi:hypothetical protein